ncbi:amidohydrolase [Candidatus Parcubacteria bacterium]|nr:amidohydrolase [Candidatus Parcubacteria bacterium]
MLKKEHRRKIITFVLFAVLIVGIFYFRYDIAKRDYNADILIKNATILTLNEHSEIIYNGWIVIQGEKIIEVGKGKHDYKSKKIVDAKGKVVMPGLVNTHAHVAMAPFRGVDDGLNFSQWISNINKYEQVVTEEDVYWSSLLGEVEMIRSGTTTYNDMYFYTENIIQSIEKTGIRAVIDVPFDLENSDLKIEEDFLLKYDRISTVTFSIAPNPLIEFSEEKLKKIKKIVDENNLIVHLHIAEDWSERNRFVERYNRTPIEMLSDSGLFNSKIVLAHSVNFTDDEIDYLSEYKDVGISFNPKSNYKLLGYTAPIKRMIEKKLTIGIGTDGVGSSNSLDMFDQMNFIAFVSKGCQEEGSFCDDQSGIDPEKIIRMATIDGAESLGLENEIGSIEEGKKADLIFVDFSRIGLTPSYNIYSSLVYNTDGSDVTDSIINGKIIMENKKISRVDEIYIVKKVGDIFEKIKNLQ